MPRSRRICSFISIPIKLNGVTNHPPTLYSARNLRKHSSRCFITLSYASTIHRAVTVRGRTRRASFTRESLKRTESLLKLRSPPFHSRFSSTLEGIPNNYLWRIYRVNRINIFLPDSKIVFLLWDTARVKSERTVPFKGKIGAENRLELGRRPAADPCLYGYMVNHRLTREAATPHV